jgi:tRNA G18 (ribose-2'-O)-methylase SpoU
MNVIFHAPEYRPNLSNMIRTAEFYGLKKVFIYDKNKLLSPPNNKVSRAEMEHMARVWTAGAIEHIEIVSVENDSTFLQKYKGRKIATLVNEEANTLSNFTFKEDDLIIMGSEKEGLRKEIEALCNEAIYIPQRGHTNCLNVSVTFGIVMQQAISQIK